MTRENTWDEIIEAARKRTPPRFTSLEECRALDLWAHHSVPDNYRWEPHDGDPTDTKLWNMGRAFMNAVELNDFDAAADLDRKIRKRIAELYGEAMT